MPTDLIHCISIGAAAEKICRAITTGLIRFSALRLKVAAKMRGEKK